MMAAPEYITWEFPIAILTCSLLLRTYDLEEATPPRIGQLALFGVFCGICGGVKITLLTFPLSICCVFAAIYRRYPRSLTKAALITGVFFLSAWFVILLLSAGVNLERLSVSIDDFMLFVGSQSQTLSFVARDNNWLFDFFPHYRFDIGPLAILAPPTLLILGTVFARLRVLLALLPASLLSIAFYGARPYWITMSETIAFAVVCWIALIAATAKALSGRPANAPIWISLPATVVIVAVIYAYGTMGYTSLKSLESISRILSDDYAKVTTALATHPGPTALFATDNRYRIPSIEGGICKGGADILDMRWHPNRYVATLFPQRLCYYFVKQPIDLKTTTNVVFVSISSNEPIQDSIRRIEQFFSISLADFHCGMAVPIVNGASYHVCFKNAGGAEGPGANVTSERQQTAIPAAACYRVLSNERVDNHCNGDT